MVMSAAPAQRWSCSRTLAASPYRGDVIVEVSAQLSNKPGYDPLAAASKCYNHLADAFVKAGLQRG